MIDSLWQEHSKATFPRKYAGVEIEGIEIVMLDADTVGCVSTFISNNGKLDNWRISILGMCYHDLAIVKRSVDRDAYSYFHRLEKLSRLVLETIRDQEAS